MLEGSILNDNNTDNDIFIRFNKLKKYARNHVLNEILKYALDNDTIIIDAYYQCS